MKVTERQLRKIIRETIKEIATPGDSRYGMAGDARGGIPGRTSRGVTFPGHSAEDNELYRQAGERQQRRLFDDPSTPVYGNRNQQGLAAPGGSYVQGVGWVDPNGNIWHGTYNAGQQAGASASSIGDAVDANMQGGRDPKVFDKLFFIIDSQVTRGIEGDIEHVPSGDIYTAQGDKSASGTLLGDLNMAFQKAGGKNGPQRAKEVIQILMDYDILEQQDIDSELVSEIAILGRDTKKVYPIEEYFMEFNNGFIKESKKNMKKVLL